MISRSSFPRLAPCGALTVQAGARLRLSETPESKYCVDYFVHNWDTYSYKLAFSESLLLLWHLKKALFLGPVNVEAAQYLSTI